VITSATTTTWGIMAFLLIVCLLLRRQLNRPELGGLQNFLELLMEELCALVREIVRSDPEPYVPFVGTLFIFVFVSNLVGMVPGLSSPTGDISVTGALAGIVFLSVPFYGVRAKGVKAYLANYIKPNAFMLPFNLIGEVTRTLSLAVRLFGNIMSGQLLLVIILGVVFTVARGYAAVAKPFAIIMVLPLTLFISVLSLITACIQAYIFTVLSLVYIGAAVERQSAPREVDESPEQKEKEKKP